MPRFHALVRVNGASGVIGKSVRLLVVEVKSDAIESASVVYSELRDVQNSPMSSRKPVILSVVMSLPLVRRGLDFENFIFLACLADTASNPFLIRTHCLMLPC